MWWGVMAVVCFAAFVWMVGAWWWPSGVDKDIEYRLRSLEQDLASVKRELMRLKEEE